MPNLPNKLQHGDAWKSASVNAINQIIDYLKSQRIVVDNKTISATQSVNGITLTAKPQTSAKPTGKGGGETTVYIDAGAAIPARMTNNITQSWQIPYEITIYPNGYGDSDTSIKKSALPLTVGFSAPPPINEPLIAFSSYILEVGGTGEGETA